MAESPSLELLKTGFNGGLGSVREMVGPDDPQGLFQPKQLCHLMTPIIQVLDVSKLHSVLYFMQFHPFLAILSEVLV